MGTATATAIEINRAAPGYRIDADGTVTELTARVRRVVEVG